MSKAPPRGRWRPKSWLPNGCSGTCCASFCLPFSLPFFNRLLVPKMDTKRLPKWASWSSKIDQKEASDWKVWKAEINHPSNGFAGFLRSRGSRLRALGRPGGLLFQLLEPTWFWARFWPQNGSVLKPFGIPSVCLPLAGRGPEINFSHFWARSHPKAHLEVILELMLN